MYPQGIDINAKRNAVTHRDRQRLGATHTAETTGESDRPCERSAEPLLGKSNERLIGALEDALSPDVDPRPSRHLAVHHQPGVLELPEVLPRTPIGNEVAVGKQHPGRHLMGAESTYRLPRLHQQGLIVLQILEVAHNGVEGIPGSGRFPPAAVDNQLIRVLGDLGIEVIHQAAKRRLLQPTLGAKLGTTRSPHGARS